MAQRRMISKKVTDTDVFLEMHLSTQALYFHLNMHADDDGFVSNVNTIMRMIGASGDDAKILIAKQFLIPFDDSGVVVIKDWRIHNYIRKDPYNETMYKEERKKLSVDANGAYQVNEPSTERARVVNETSPQVRLGKDRLGKDSKDIRAPKIEFSEDFEKLWEMYPNKKGKNVAQKAFNKAIKDGDTVEQIRAGIEAYKAYTKAEGTPVMYIKHGSTFFNQRSWNDDYTIQAKPSQRQVPVRETQPDWDNQPVEIVSAEKQLELDKMLAHMSDRRREAEDKHGIS
ncbi:DNA replication protein [Weissella diestrammenae]|uniref:DNA replication protein n=1 Tax=Weissella diestrammenae TaxID=1162633 RepID=UPI001FACC7E8|nr:DNA replication protein [Weissella diestrammenae]